MVQDLNDSPNGFDYVGQFHWSRLNPGARRAYLVHDNIVQKTGSGVANNNFSVNFGNGDYTVIYFAPLMAHTETGTKYSGLYY